MDKEAAAVTRRVKAMTRLEVLNKAVAGGITWVQAASILGVTDRHVRRLRERYRRDGRRGLEDGRACPRRARVLESTLTELCRLRRELYADFSVRHFYEFATRRHDLQLSYTKAKAVLQAADLAPKSKGRGKHRRRRPRRPLFGMMMHLDASTHRWIEALPHQDLVVMLDDATSRVLYARFFPQEGLLSTCAALKHVLQRYGRFCELYTDRGSHFCNTTRAEEGPSELQQGPIARVMQALSIQHIWAYSPQARGRGERAFGTIQGRLPQELALAGIGTYEDANAYLESTFIASYNDNFSVTPTHPESAFTPLCGVDLDLLVSVTTERIVRNDNTVLYDKVFLQLPKMPDRLHFVRCKVLVHQFPEGDLGVSHDGVLLARYHRSGALRVVRTRGRDRRIREPKPPVARKPRKIARASGHL